MGGRYTRCGFRQHYWPHPAVRYLNETRNVYKSVNNIMVNIVYHCDKLQLYKPNPRQINNIHWSDHHPFPFVWNNRKNQGIQTLICWLLINDPFQEIKTLGTYLWETSLNWLQTYNFGIINISKLMWIKILSYSNWPRLRLQVLNLYHKQNILMISFLCRGLITTK